MDHHHDHGHHHAHDHSHAHPPSSDSHGAHHHDHAEFPPGFLLGTGVLAGLSLLSSWFPEARWAALGAVILGLPPVAKKGLLALRHRVMDINFLMTVAVGGALVIGEWEEAAAVCFLFAIAEWLEDQAMDRARSAIAAVMGLAPDTAVLVSGEEVPAAKVTIGTRLLLKPGARVPLDARVVSGQSTVDESALTGESLPVGKEAGHLVSAGTVNQGGALELETTALAGDSAIARMGRLVEEAQSARSPTERWVDRFSRIYTPAVVVLAAAVAILPPLALGAPWSPWFYKALVLLVVACPCALVLSTPVTIVSALARAARAGVLVKGGKHLETLGEIRALALDKTGTLTSGQFQVVDCLPLDGHSETELHRLVAAVESRSSHPLAGALLQHAGAEAGMSAGTWQTVEGEGVEATVDGKTVHIGNHRMAERLGVHEPGEHARLDAWMSEGRTVVYVVADQRLVGHLSLADLPRPEARAAVAALRKWGLSPVILSGDNSGTAAAVARLVDIPEVMAELLPAGKVSAIQSLKNRYGMVGMVGDGINDGPALAAADVGIAMGVRGTAVAMEAADVALMGDDLGRLAWAVGLGRAALRRVKLNVGLAIGAKLLVMALAVVGIANLWLAVAADVGVSLLVITLGLAMLRYPMETSG